VGDHPLTRIDIAPAPFLFSISPFAEAERSVSSALVGSHPHGRGCPHGWQHHRGPPCCIIRAMPTIDSDGSRPPPLSHADQLFQRMASDFSGAPGRNRWSPWFGISARHAPESGQARLAPEEAAPASRIQLWHSLPRKHKEAKMSQERLTMRKISKVLRLKWACCNDSPAITHLPADAGAKPEKWWKLSP